MVRCCTLKIKKRITTINLSLRMLFQRLYNWIKYKTLPPSVLFKNRLFVERDSKHKRILNNFGLIFRNSKWSNYETYNIKSQFRLSFYKYIFLFVTVFFFILILFNFNKYYICYYFFNSLSFLFWVSFDAFDYYFSFLIWLLTISSSLLFNLVYSYFFFNNFSENKNIKKIFTHKFFSNNYLITAQNVEESSLSKHDFSWIFYFWLNNSSGKNTFFLENIFDNTLNKNYWKGYYDFFIKLYKLTFFCTLSSQKNSIYEKNLNFDKIINIYFNGDKTLLLIYFSNTSLFLNHFKTIFRYTLSSYTNYFVHTLKKNNNNFFFNKHDQNLQSLQCDLTFYNFLIKNKIGLFFFKDLTFENLSFLNTNRFEFTSINQNVVGQINSAKWNRWLYKYSILQRKLLKNSHKITLSKKLINSGFYNSSLFDKNLWASENFMRYETNPSSLNSFFSIYYPSLNNSDFAWITSLLYNKSNSRHLELLNFHENSFFWFVKRFYFLNDISANLIKNRKLVHFKNPKTLESYIKQKDDATSTYFSLFSIFFKFSRSSTENFTNFFKITQITPASTILTEIKKNRLSKDFQIFFDENNLLTKENLDILYWLVTRPSSEKNISFFNYNSFGANDVKFSDSFQSSSSFNEKKNLTKFTKVFNTSDLIFFICLLNIF